MRTFAKDESSVRLNLSESTSLGEEKAFFFFLKQSLLFSKRSQIFETHGIAWIRIVKLLSSCLRPWNSECCGAEVKNPSSPVFQDGCFEDRDAGWRVFSVILHFQHIILLHYDVCKQCTVVNWKNSSQISWELQTQMQLESKTHARLFHEDGISGQSFSGQRCSFALTGSVLLQ